MRSLKESGEQLEDLFGWIASEYPYLAPSCERESLNELLDGVVTILDDINSASIEDEISGCGFTSPESALKEGTKILKAFSRLQWFELVFQDFYDEYEECEEEDIIYLDMFKIFEFEAWSEVKAYYFQPLKGII